MPSTSFMSYFLFVFFLLAALVSASPIAKRDVFVPPITYPHAGTVWKVGQKHNVTWSLDNIPDQITNPTGKIVLAQAGLLVGLDTPLAEGFNITLGRYEITVPDVDSGSNYSLVLFGDSGNNSPDFTITK